MNIYPRVDLTYHADGDVGIGTPPQVKWDASAPLVMGEPVERLRVSMTDGAQEERNKLAAWMMRQGYATGHGDSTEDLLKELEWQIEESVRNEREACAKVLFDYAERDDLSDSDESLLKHLFELIRARGQV
jgi:hypothetical protein